MCEDYVARFTMVPLKALSVQHLLDIHVCNFEIFNCDLRIPSSKINTLKPWKTTIYFILLIRFRLQEYRCELLHGRWVGRT